MNIMLEIAKPIQSQCVLVWLNVMVKCSGVEHIVMVLKCNTKTSVDDDVNKICGGPCP